MCGICGIVTGGPAPDPALVEAMMAQLAHRGPDGSGYLVDGEAALGHTRLAIIDAPGGTQPLSNEDHSVWVTFNGEIFNYVELRTALRKRGHRFRTESDTEVIVHAWEEWAEDAFNRFNGQWAIGIWDRRAHRLVLSRDRLGVRPLYYRLAARGISFASEVKAIFADPQVPRELDPVGLGQILTFWSTVAPRTAFRGIEQLPPGHVATYDAAGFRSQPYWRITFPARGEEPGQDLAENAAGLRARLIEATRLRFERSDVPVGAYLSGGLDSSVTAAAIRSFTTVPLDTFSLRFTDAEFDEGGYQRLMAQRLGTRHQEIEVSTRQIADVFPDVVWHAETPVLRSAPAPLFLLSRLVRQSGYKVVVTGEGADEVLGGYDIYREARVRAFWSRDPGSAQRDRAAELLYPWLERNPSKAPAFARGFFGMSLDTADPAMSHRPRWSSTAVLRSMLASGLRAELDADAAPSLIARMPPESSSWDPLARAQWLEMTTLLPGYILASQGDRMLMANSVEGRFPFLDPEVVAFASALPARHKLFGLDEKFLLKQAFADLVPEEILYRPKQPYRAPDAASFFAPGSPDWIDEVLSPSAVLAAAVFDPRQVAGLTQKARERSDRFGNTDNMRMLAILSTQLLHRQFIAEPPARVAASPPGPVHVVNTAISERQEA
ncbi:MAG: asparagine synthase (glutamine-hydrolyzing) [Propionibacteriaceae bacterium]|jgi:asparagine synthase (glutamine-hydrolysing)|nr:asparagine synthase (glutamine-hydrolyzing) [Propionibacteriaceae bacterium]